jgi:hypothetical protein
MSMMLPNSKAWETDPSGMAVLAVDTKPLHTMWHTDNASCLLLLEKCGSRMRWPCLSTVPAEIDPDEGIHHALQQQQQQQQQHHQQQQQQQQQLNQHLLAVWSSILQDIEDSGNSIDFKSPGLPFARIKKIMKSDDDVRVCVQ